ncbi:hypothetical protein ABKV19_017587 [Rosa sericea]
MTMNQGDARSLFIVVDFPYNGPYFSSVFEIKLGEMLRGQTKEEEAFAFVGQLSQTKWRQPISWMFSSLATATSCSSTDLCLLPDGGPEDFKIDVPLHGYIFNIRTKKVRKMKPPKASKCLGHVVSLKGHIYFITDPYWLTGAPDPSFERYLPDKDSWETLTHFPRIEGMSCNGQMVAIAVCDEFILFNIDARIIGCQMWAYDVSRNKWYLVKVENYECYGIRGVAVVLEETIYALTHVSFESVLALSITREQIDGDLVFTCSLHSVIEVPYMELFPLGEGGPRSRHLVHLGHQEFCLVQSGLLPGYNDRQPIKLSIIKLVGKNSMNITDEIVYEVNLLDFLQFRVRLCFSPPEYEDFVLKEEDKGDIFFNFDPVCEDIVSKQEDKSDTDFTFNPESEVVKPVQEEEVATLPIQGETIVDTSSLEWLQLSQSGIFKQ